MAKARMISRSISTSRKLARVDDRAALLFTWIQPHTDDFGRLEGDAMTVRAKVCPMRPYTDEEVENSLQKLHEAGLIALYTVKKERYLQVCGFEEHQTFKTDRPRRAEYPEPEDGNVCPIEENTDMVQMAPTGTRRKPNGTKRPRKLSQVKLSKVNTIAAQGAAGDGAIVNKIIEGFKEVNPSYTRIYANKTQRTALERLLKQHGVEKLQAIIAYLPKSNATKYAPTITTPIQLEDRIGALLAWAQKQKDSGSKKQIII